MEKLYIIDGYGIFFRAFFAMKNVPNHLTNYNAIFGTMRMLISIINQFNPEKIIVALDTGGKTFRDDIYLNFLLQNELKILIQNLNQNLQTRILNYNISNEELIYQLKLNFKDVQDVCRHHLLEVNYNIILMIYNKLLTYETKIEVVKSQYKANRKETPDQLKPQFQILPELLQAMNINFLKKENYEADDIIATLCSKFQKNHKIIIISSDKDLMQLINKNISIYNPIEKIIFNEDAFEKKFNFKAKNFIDYLSLIGDVADNIPGVKGIGKKTAFDLIKDFQTIDNILLNIIKISNEKVKKLLIDNIEVLKLSYKLIKLEENINFSEEVKINFKLNNNTLKEFIDKYNLSFALKEKKSNEKTEKRQIALFDE